MAAAVFIVGILYAVLAGLTFFRPYFILRAIDLLDINWSADRGLFSSSRTVRTCVGILFLLAGAALLCSTYVLIFE